MLVKIAITIPHMTIARVREILKISEDELSDEEIQKIIDLTRELARLYLKDLLYNSFTNFYKLVN